MGRPRWKITPEVVEKAKGFAARGLTMQQIASCFGVSYETLRRKKRDIKVLEQAILDGRALGVFEIANRLFENAKAGDTTAQIFYLKNRDPENWRDRRDIKHEGEIRTSILVPTDFPDGDSDD